MPDVGLNSRPQDQQLRALLTEPARPSLFLFHMYLFIICFSLPECKLLHDAQSLGSQLIFAEWMSMSFMALTSGSTTVNKIDTQKSYNSVDELLSAGLKARCVNHFKMIFLLGAKLKSVLKQISPGWDSKINFLFLFQFEDQDTGLFSIPPLPQQTLWWQESMVGVIKRGARIRILAASLPHRET